MERQDAAFFMLSNAPYLILVLASSCFGDFLTPCDIFLVSQFPLPRFSTSFLNHRSLKREECLQSCSLM